MAPAERRDAIVIGAGMSGLAAGIRLAQAGKSVAILERHSLWGGLNSFYKRGGRRLDTGLHALTNYAGKGQRGAPLTRLLRQLRIGWDELALAPQSFSEIAFPGARLGFENGIGRLESEVAAAFPAERDGFARLVRAVRECDPFDPAAPYRSGRAALADFVGEPLLCEMILCPILFYGSAVEDDVDWSQLAILFRSIFLEGLARPEGGVKRILDLLVARFRAAGGDLRLRTGVRGIRVERGAARGVLLDDGGEIACDLVLSSAGLPETRRLAGLAVEPGQVGRLSFLESISVLDRPLAALGHAATMTFFCDAPRFSYRRPAGLVDATSGVICASDNYRTAAPPVEGVLRVTVIANHERWAALDEEGYRAAKKACAREALDAAARHAPDPRPFAVHHDVATPRTIERYTGRLGGAVYGSPRKSKDGACGIENLSLIGTDTGLVGIVGALMSGITTANRRILVASR